MDSSEHALPGKRSSSWRGLLVVGISCLLIVVVLVAAFQLGYLALGPRFAARHVDSPYAIIPGKSAPFSQFPLMPYYDATTTRGNGFGVRFRLNVTSFVSGTFTSTNGADFFIFPSDSGGDFFSSLSRGLADAQGFTFTTGVVKTGNFNVSLAASTWEIWMIDPSSQNTTIIVTQPIQAVALCNSGPVCYSELQNP